jgi:hypothetical protein
VPEEVLVDVVDAGAVAEPAEVAGEHLAHQHLGIDDDAVEVEDDQLGPVAH